MFDGTSGPWLSIIGLGEDGRDGLSNAARSLIQTAKLVIGGKRHLALVQDLAQNTLAWPTPLEAAISDILELRGQPVVILASGDPFYHGVGVTLSKHLKREEYISLPQPSAFSLAANRLAWPLQDTTTLGLNKHPAEVLLPHLYDGARILTLSRDGTTPSKIGKLLCDHGFGQSTMTVLTAMGGGNEDFWSGAAHAIGDKAFANLNTIAIEVSADKQAKVHSRASGLPDAWFANDGQLTKREVRAVTLSSLAPKPGQHLWDIGCGAGSVAIEWMLSHSSCSATGVERDATRASRAAQNAAQLGVPDLKILTGDAAALITDLPTPDAVFFGGGAKDPALIDVAWEALPNGGRLVVNAVTLETQAVLQDQYAKRGGEFIRISVERAEPVGKLTGWRPAMPVVQWVGVKS